MSKDTICYGELIRNVRKKHKMTQTELGDKISVGKTTISNYETSYSFPSAQILESIAAVFDMSLVEFLCYDNDEMQACAKCPRLSQPVNDVVVPYVKMSNLTQDILDSESYMDSYLSFPGSMLEYDSGYICVKMTDDSMVGEGISKNDYLIIKKEKLPKNRSIVLFCDNKNKKFMVRKYIREDHILSFIPSVNNNKLPIIRTDERDDEYTVAGYVEKVIVSMN